MHALFQGADDGVLAMTRTAGSTSEMDDAQTVKICDRTWEVFTDGFALRAETFSNPEIGATKCYDIMVRSIPNFSRQKWIESMGAEVIRG